MKQNLIIQGKNIQTAILKQLAKESAATAIEAISITAEHTQAFRLVNAEETTSLSIAEICSVHALDFGYIPQHRRLDDFRLVAMDMDSTLIAIECIDEIADMNGLKPQVAKITEAAMRGDIEFAESLKLRVALLAGLESIALQAVYSDRLRLNPGANTLITTLQRHGIKTLLISGGFTYFTQRLQSELHLDYSAANVLEIENGKLTGRVLGDILDAKAKAEKLNRLRDELGLQQNQLVSIGDGANDVPMLQQAAVSVAYHAKPVVRQHATYALNFNNLASVLPLLGAT